MKKQRLFIVVCFLFSLLAAGCATSSGSLFRDITVPPEQNAPPKEKNPPQKEKDNPEEIKQKQKDETVQPEDEANGKKGLSIDSNPQNAQVFINGFYAGTTPLTVEDIQPGDYSVKVIKEGYYPETRWIQYKDGEFISFTAYLQEITGFLDVSYSPQDALVFIDSEPGSMGLQSLPVGNHTVTVKAFGYTAHSETVQVYENQTTSVTGSLQPAAFRITGIRASRPEFNPGNSGPLGKTDIIFDVTTYGSGTVEIFDEEKSLAASFSLPQFTTWVQRYVWDGRDTKGTVLPDGQYTVRIEARGRDEGKKDSAELSVTIDSSLRIIPRNTWSGTSGLLYVPIPETLPLFSSQLAFRVLGHAEIIQSSLYTRFPLQISFRFTPFSSLELAVQGSLIPQSADTTPFSLGLSAKYIFFQSRFFSGAAVLKGTYFTGETEDTQSNYAGISAGVPIEISFLPQIKLELMPEIVISPVRVLYSTTGSYAQQSLYIWNYFRAGLLFDFNGFWAGISGSFRFSPFGNPYTVDWPAAAGAEISWTLPGTQIAVEAEAAAEFSPTAGFYILAGLGFSLLN